MISNTKGFTGHAMGVGVEDVVAIKAIETGVVPPVPNHREPDPDLGNLNLSRGGSYPVQYALRLGAGFGSQISLTLYRVVPAPDGRHPEPGRLGYEYRIVDLDRWNQWLSAASGLPGARVEIERRTLRVMDAAAASPPYADLGPAASQPAQTAAHAARDAATVAPTAPTGRSCRRPSQ